MSIESAFKAGEAALAGEFHKIVGEAKVIPTELDKAAAAILTDAKPFVEHAAVAALQEAAKLKIAALNEMTVAKAAIMNELETAKTTALSDVAALKTRVEALLANLAETAASAAVSGVEAAVTKAA